MIRRKDMKVLVINAGSSSIKYKLYLMPEARVLAKGIVDRIGEDASELRQQSDIGTITEAAGIADHDEGIRLLLNALSQQEGPVNDISEIDAVGHRVVHGGEEFTGSVLIDEKVLSSIEKFADLAPLHNPPNLTGIKATQHNLPAVPQVACFDTAFHATIPEVAYMYALPYKLYQKYGIRRYTFHGTSHRHVARRAAQLMGVEKYDCNVITAHLGNGCSITAVKNGKSVDTSMGLTPLEGLVMGTRCGDIDPAIIFYLHDKGYDVKSI
ncbi:MAG: acetate/propionate family kinase, partial [Anaerolineales bacterium]|nr:acetate/propionate family kinase [Anaerolineales bacterium]